MLKLQAFIITIIVIGGLLVMVFALAKEASLEDERRERDYQEYLKRRHDLKWYRFFCRGA